MDPPEPERRRWTAVGLMSGTSMDGVDAALVRIAYIDERVEVDLVAANTSEYPPEIVTLLHDITSLNVDGIARLNFDLGEVFARAAIDIIDRSGVSPTEIDVIGSHGQTVSHQPRSLAGAGATLQLGEPAVIAERTGIGFSRKRRCCGWRRCSARTVHRLVAVCQTRQNGGGSQYRRYSQCYRGYSSVGGCHSV